MKNYVQDGKSLDFTASGTITSGQLVQVGNLHGVATTGATTGQQVVLQLEGVYTLPKLVAAAGDACVLGEPVYFSSGSVSGTDASGTRLPVGIAMEAAAQAVTTVKVRLDN